MKYDGDWRATARFFSVKDVAGLLFLLRRLTRRGRKRPVVSVPRPAGHGTGAFTAPAGIGDSVRQPVALF